MTKQRKLPGKIAILLPDLRGGGVERIRLELAREFARLGHDVEFVLMQARGELLEEAGSAFRIMDLGVERIRHLVPSLVRYLRRERPDALLAAMWPLTVIAPIARLISGHRCSVLISEHAILSLQYASWGWKTRLKLSFSQSVACRIADQRIAVSSGVAHDWAKLAHLDRMRFSVIHNPVRHRPASDSVSLNQAEALWRSPRGKRIITVGSMKGVKNQHMLLRTFRLIDDPAANLLLLGKGALEPELRQLAAQLGIADRVIFAGFHSDPTPFYMTADLFVLSSDHEGFGNVIVEALACGLPVVSTDCPSGPAEILENGRYGRLTPVGDAEALARAMQEALTAPADREALKRRAADFAPEKVARRYVELMLPAGFS